MGKKGWIVLIFVALAVNVAMLDLAMEAHHALENTKVYVCTAVSMVAVALTLFGFFQWRKLEYKK